MSNIFFATSLLDIFSKDTSSPDLLIIVTLFSSLAKPVSDLLMSFATM